MTSSGPNWAALVAEAPRVRIRRSAWRLVESQEQVATNALVDTLEEQQLLEELIEATKPARQPGTAGLHYLLATPFRYPPLLWGSRFGGRHEPALFYAATEPATALAEAAYYRCLFWQAMATPPPSARLLSQHTLFSAAVDTRQALRLQAAPFDEHTALLRHPSRYAETQALGAAMRDAEVLAFEYRSARTADGVNLALFQPAAFAGKHPQIQQPWLCDTRADAVSFIGDGQTLRFPLESFLVSGALPQPA